MVLYRVILTNGRTFRSSFEVNAEDSKQAETIGRQECIKKYPKIYAPTMWIESVEEIPVPK
jgi:hypothetical protein